MNAPKRLLILAVIAAALATPRTTSQTKTESWAGQQVIPNRSPELVRFGDRIDGKQVYFNFADGSYSFEVLRERAGWLRLHDGEREGWADKAHFVRVRDAPAYFHRRLQANANDSWALYMRAVGWLGKGELENSIKDATELIRRDPSQSGYYGLRGTARSRQGDYDEAIKDYTEALRLRPDYAAAFHNRGLAYLRKKQYDDAIEDFTEAVRFRPANHSAFHNRGNAWIYKEEYDRAIQDYDEAIRLYPKYPSSYNSRGYAWYRKGRYDRAVQDYTDAVQLDPDYLLALDNRGDTFRAMGDYRRAIRDYGEVIKLDPNDGKMLNRLAWLLATCPEDEARDGKLAVTYSTKSCELSKWRDSDRISTLAASYAEVGDYDKAVKYQKQALESLGRDGAVATELRERLKLFEAGRPYRETIEE